MIDVTVILSTIYHRQFAAIYLIEGCLLRTYYVLATVRYSGE